MPRARFRESAILRDADGKFASKPGGPTKKYRKGSGPKRRKLAQKLLRDELMITKHREYSDNVRGKQSVGKRVSERELGGVRNAENQISRLKGSKAATRSVLDELLEPPAETAQKRSTPARAPERRVPRGKLRVPKPVAEIDSDPKPDPSDKGQLQKLQEWHKRQLLKEGLTGSTYRARRDEIDKRSAETMDAVVENKTPENQAAYRDAMAQMLAMIEVEDQIQPKRDVEVWEADGDLDRIQEIFMDRHPGTMVYGFNDRFDLTGGRKGTYKMDPYGAQEALQALDEMMVQYPDVKVDKVNPTPGMQDLHGHDRVIAHCVRRNFGMPGAAKERVVSQIEFNSKLMENPLGSSDSGANRFRSMMAADDKKDRPFHPHNFGQEPFRNTIIHEFGHALDWVAFGVPPLADAPDGRKTYGEHETRDKMVKRALVQAWRDEGSPEPDSRMSRMLMDRGASSYRTERGKLNLWLREQLSGYSYKGRGEGMNMDELIAEAFADVHINGDKASPATRAVYETMMSEMSRRMQERIGQWYEEPNE